MRNWRTLKLLPALTAGLFLMACGGDDGAAGTAGQASGTAASGGMGTTASQPAASISGAVPAAMQAFQDDGNVVEIVIEGNDQMRFDIEQFSVAPGQMVRLTLHHVGNLPAQAMGHNVVILQQGEDFFEFGADVGEAGGNQQNDYVPESLRDRVVAFTPLIGGGETTTVEFQAPTEAGDYPFLCSFPGHFGQMNGTMQVS